MIVKIAPVILALVISGNGFGSESKNADRDEEAIKERVRYEILTLYAIYEGVRFAGELGQNKRDHNWPIGTTSPANPFKKAAIETVGDMEDSDCMRSFGATGGADWATEKSFSVAPFIIKNKDLDPVHGAKIVWRSFLDVESEIQREVRENYEYTYARAFKGRNQNQTLDLAINYLLQINFKETENDIVESQLFMAMRILRCVWLMYPDYQAPALETFISRNLRKISIGNEILMGKEVGGKLSLLILDNEAMNRLERGLFVTS